MHTSVMSFSSVCSASTLGLSGSFLKQPPCSCSSSYVHVRVAFMTLVTLNLMMCASLGIAMDGWTFSFWKCSLHHPSMPSLSAVCMSSLSVCPCGMGKEPKMCLWGSTESSPGGGSTWRSTLADRTSRLQLMMLLEALSQRTMRSVSEAPSLCSLVL